MPTIECIRSTWERTQLIVDIFFAPFATSYSWLNMYWTIQRDIKIVDNFLVKHI